MELNAALGILEAQNLVRTERHHSGRHTNTVVLNTMGFHGSLPRQILALPTEDVWNDVLQSNTVSVALIPLHV
ncbi:hypothetical protein D3C72_1408860 [compost metagenome]